MKILDKTFLITSLLCLLPIALGLLFYNELPENIIIHWNSAGDPDGYAPKLFGVLGLPLFMFFINTVVHFAINTDPKNQDQSSKMITIGKWIIPIMTLIIVPMSLFASMGADIPIVTVIILMIGILFIVIGNYLPKSRQSYTVGIRLPWTLNSEENWKRTHRISGYIWIIGGIVMVLTAFTPELWFVFFFPILVVLIGVPVGYSYYLYRKGV